MKTATFNCAVFYATIATAVIGLVLMSYRIEERIVQ